MPNNILIYVFFSRMENFILTIQALKDNFDYRLEKYILTMYMYIYVVYVIEVYNTHDTVLKSFPDSCIKVKIFFT